MEFVLARGAEDQAWCARLMSESEPWLTLRRDYTACVGTVTHPQGELILALRDGQPAGFILLRLDGWMQGYVQSVAVHPSQRGNGVGSALLAEAERRIFARVPNVFMCVSSFNAGAQALYRRLGYERVGVLTNYLVDGHDEILLRKSRGPLNPGSGELT